MKKILLSAVLLMAAFMLNCFAEDNGAQEKSEKAQGKGEKHSRPSPEQQAEKMMKKFDANKDEKLSQDELIQALKERRERRAKKGKSEQEQKPVEEVASRMIENFSSDKTSLTQAELAKALEAQRANRGKHGKGKHGKENQEGQASQE